MSHPYRMQLSNSCGEFSPNYLETGEAAKKFQNVHRIIPHQILAKQQIATKSKTAHPFLQQLPSDLSKSLKSLHVTTPQSSTFSYTPGASPNESINQNSPVRLSQPSKETVSNTMNVIRNQIIADSNIAKDEVEISSFTETGKYNQFQLGPQQKSATLSNPSGNSLESQYKKIGKTTILAQEGNTGVESPQTETDKGKFFYEHKKTKSTANLIHPVLNNISQDNLVLYNNTSTLGEQVIETKKNSENKNNNSGIITQDEHVPLSQNSSTSGVALLPMERSIEMYRQNAKKTKDPGVLFSFAQILIKTSLSKRGDNPLSDKEKQEYLNEAHVALKKASKSGYVEAQYYLGDACSVGLFSKWKPELSKSLTYFELAGKARHAESAYRTAVCYKKGWGCTRDARKAVKYLEIAAINNHPVAMMECGIYAFHGMMSYPEDINTKKKGISWLRRATECATELSCGAPYELALIYMNGFKDIVIKDTKYAIKLLFIASNLGHAKSASMLGKFYEIGDVVDANADLSIHFYNMSATLGDADGMMGLCSWYFVGSEHLPQDYYEAFAWALRAADTHKHVKAMLLLERFYERGVGCEKNLEKSQYWGELAKTQQEKK